MKNDNRWHGGIHPARTPHIRDAAQASRLPPARPWWADAGMRWWPYANTTCRSVGDVRAWPDPMAVEPAISRSQPSPIDSQLTQYVKEHRTPIGVRPARPSRLSRRCGINQKQVSNIDTSARNASSLLKIIQGVGTDRWGGWFTPCRERRQGALSLAASGKAVGVTPLWLPHAIK